ncbi:MAG: hypothetical protein SNG49_01070 [Rikenellaceae bacterium]
MRKFFTLSLICALGFLLTSCSDNNDGIYVSASGEGSIVVGYDSPVYLYRMVLFTSDDEQEIYLMGSSAYVSADGQFAGRGGVVKFTIPNTVDNTTITAQTFDISSSDYSVDYSTYVNYSMAEGDDDLLSVSSGTVIIRKSGSYYDIRLIGLDDDEQSLLISYRGYIYRTIVESSDASYR